MAAETSIEWAANADGTPGATWNPLRARDTATGRVGTFCVHASEGCRNCYAETFQGRKLPGNGVGLAYTAPNLKRVEHYLDDKMLLAPLRRKKPTTYFLSSMTDVFGEWVPDAMIDKLWAVMGLATRHTFIVVTKRAARMRAYCSSLGMHHERDRVSLQAKELDSILKLGERGFWYTLKDGGAHLPNVWLVVSVEDQANANARIPELLATPAAVRGVSCEPLLGLVDLTRIPFEKISPEECGAERCCGGQLYSNALDNRTASCDGPCDGEAISARSLDWVICGGESGAKARPMHPDWARALRDQCADAGVPFFFKQWGEWIADPLGRTVAPGDVQISRDAVFHRVGKHKAGRTLDGREHSDRPNLARPA